MFSNCFSNSDITLDIVCTSIDFIAFVMPLTVSPMALLSCCIRIAVSNLEATASILLLILK